ncbi:MAG: hypothetical protein CMJ78_06835 [Planctomycetaceae bacterium]|nr:hypothetical protein [Planctomycetaceae bacterium]
MITTMRNHGNKKRKTASRRGSVLLAVLVIVSLLALGAYTFSNTMVTEAEATGMYTRRVETRMYADSGVELVKAILSEESALGTTNYYHDPDRLRAVMMRNSDATRGRGYFSVVAPVESDQTSTSARSGFRDESSKININALTQLSFSDEAERRELLMFLPNMTMEIADAILDFIDEDFEAREFGVESEYYMELEPPYYAKDKPLDTLDELLKVAGVTEQLLYGEDQNRNGLLDQNENDGDQTLPMDNADGALDLGWSAYLTVYGKENNTREDGSDRIFVNNNTLTDLYDALAEEFGDDIAQFIVAYRMSGASEDPYLPEEDPASEEGGDSPSDGANGTQNVERSASDIAKQLYGTSGESGSVTRGGMDLSKGANTNIDSLYQLVGVKVDVEVDGQMTTLDSPVSADPVDLLNTMPLLLDGLTVTEDKVLKGRINVNQARYETLMGVPNMTETIVTNILGSQLIDSSGAPLSDDISSRSTTAWLVAEGLVTLQDMRVLDKYLTARGSIYTVQVVGFFEEGGPFTRVEAVFDTSGGDPKLLMQRDLTELGAGYSKNMLLYGAP